MNNATAAQKEAVEVAYAGSVQGFFIKPASMRELQGIIRKILDYWGSVVRPVITRVLKAPNRQSRSGVNELVGILLCYSRNN